MHFKKNIYIILIGFVIIGIVLTYGYKRFESNQQFQTSSGPSAGKITTEKDTGVTDQVLRLKLAHENIYGHVYSPKNTKKNDYQLQLFHTDWEEIIKSWLVMHVIWLIKVI